MSRGSVRCGGGLGSDCEECYGGVTPDVRVICGGHTWCKGDLTGTPVAKWTPLTFEVNTPVAF